MGEANCNLDHRLEHLLVLQYFAFLKDYTKYVCMNDTVKHVLAIENCYLAASATKQDNKNKEYFKVPKSIFTFSLPGLFSFCVEIVW